MLEFILIFAVLAADQISKALVDANLALGESAPLVGGIVQLTSVHNTGAAWGILPNARWLFLIATPVLCLLIALLLQRSNRINNLTRTIVFMPYCLSMILQAYVWKYMYSDVLYGLFSIPNPLGSQFWAIIGISFICIWADTGYCMIIYVAALQGISKDYYEAAEISGASKWQQFWKITLPMLWPAVVSNVIIYLGWGLRVYDYPMAATSGGPGRASETIAMLIYKNLFSYHKAGYGQALAIVYTAMIFVVIAVVAKLLRKREVDL